MSTTRTPKRTKQSKGSARTESSADAPVRSEDSPPPTKPAQPTEFEDEQSVESVILSKLLAHPMYDRTRLEALRDSIDWEGRYKPTIDELAHARDVAEAVANALFIGSDESWKTINDLWKIVRYAGQKNVHVHLQVEAIAITIRKYQRNRQPADLDEYARKLQSTLAYWDPAFNRLDQTAIASAIANAKKDRGGKGGRGNRAARGVLIKLSLSCGANDAPPLDPTLEKDDRRVTSFKRNIRSYATRGEQQVAQAKLLTIV